MGFLRTSLLASISLWSLTTCDPIWPNEQTDRLEELLFEQTGPRANGVAGLVKDCVGPPLGPGRSFAAEWLRNAYHDMATADVFAGTGGVDASIIYETQRGENVGAAFNETMSNFFSLPTKRSSMADLFALAVVMAVGACSNGSVVIPFSAGRVDAIKAGQSGVPQPQEELASHTASFARQGFNATEMIALVACGHTIGGVHGADFPQIVSSTPIDADVKNKTTFFDTTTNIFDNRVATEYIRNTTTNPLVAGQNLTTRSDFRIFNLDGGDMMRKMSASNDFFLSTCNALLERMINTVPKNVALTDPIEFYPVKPSFIDVAVLPDGNMTVSGVVRIENRQISDSKAKVRIHLRPRSGKAPSDKAPYAVADGLTADSMTSGCVYGGNCPASFAYYNFTTSIPTETGVSSVTVEIVDGGTEGSVVHDNGGNGFALNDTILPIRSMSLREDKSSGTEAGRFIHNTVNLTVAVLNAERFKNVTATFYSFKNPSIPSGEGYIEDNVAMTRLHKVEGTSYTYYTLLHDVRDFTAVDQPFDLAATGPEGSVFNSFISWENIPFIEIKPATNASTAVSTPTAAPR